MRSSFLQAFAARGGSPSQTSSTRVRACPSRTPRAPLVDRAAARSTASIGWNLIDLRCDADRTTTGKEIVHLIAVLVAEDVEDPMRPGVRLRAHIVVAVADSRRKNIARRLANCAAASTVRDPRDHRLPLIRDPGPGWDRVAFVPNQKPDVVGADGQVDGEAIDGGRDHPAVVVGDQAVHEGAVSGWVVPIRRFLRPQLVRLAATPSPDPPTFSVAHLTAP